MRKKNRKCIECGKPSFGRRCKECFTKGSYSALSKKKAKKRYIEKLRND